MKTLQDKRLWIAIAVAVALYAAYAAGWLGS